MFNPAFNSGSTIGTWDQCNAYCTASYPGATMLCVNIAAESDWIRNQIGVNKYWVGYTDMPPYGGGKGTKQYSWVTGCTSTYTNWYPGSPDNYVNNEDYAVIWDSGKWNDVSATFPGVLCGCQYKLSTIAPSTGPTAAPSTVAPSKGPTAAPSTVAPSTGPTAAPSTVAPSAGPTVAPFELPRCPAGWTLQCGCQWSPPY